MSETEALSGDESAMPPPPPVNYDLDKTDLDFDAELTQSHPPGGGDDWGKGGGDNPPTGADADIGEYTDIDDAGNTGGGYGDGDGDGGYSETDADVDAIGHTREIKEREETGNHCDAPKTATSSADTSATGAGNKHAPGAFEDDLDEFAKGMALTQSITETRLHQMITGNQNHRFCSMCQEERPLCRCEACGGDGILQACPVCCGMCTTHDLHTPLCFSCGADASAVCKTIYPKLKTCCVDTPWCLCCSNESPLSMFRLDDSTARQKGDDDRSTAELQKRWMRYNPARDALECSTHPSQVCTGFSSTLPMGEQVALVHTTRHPETLLNAFGNEVGPMSQIRRLLGGCTSIGNHEFVPRGAPKFTNVRPLRSTQRFTVATHSLIKKVAHPKLSGGMACVSIPLNSVTLAHLQSRRVARGAKLRSAMEDSLFFRPEVLKPGPDSLVPTITHALRIPIPVESITDGRAIDPSLVAQALIVPSLVAVTSASISDTKGAHNRAFKLGFGGTPPANAGSTAHMRFQRVAAITSILKTPSAARAFVEKDRNKRLVSEKTRDAARPAEDKKSWVHVYTAMQNITNTRDPVAAVAAIDAVVAYIAHNKSKYSLQKFSQRIIFNLTMCHEMVHGDALQDSGYTKLDAVLASMIEGEHCGCPGDGGSGDMEAVDVAAHVHQYLMCGETHPGIFETLRIPAAMLSGVRESDKMDTNAYFRLMDLAFVVLEDLIRTSHDSEISSSKAGFPGAPVVGHATQGEITLRDGRILLASDKCPCEHEKITRQLVHDKYAEVMQRDGLVPLDDGSGNFSLPIIRSVFQLVGNNAEVPMADSTACWVASKSIGKVPIAFASRDCVQWGLWMLGLACGMTEADIQSRMEVDSKAREGEGGPRSKELVARPANLKASFDGMVQFLAATRTNRGQVLINSMHPHAPSKVPRTSKPVTGFEPAVFDLVMEHVGNAHAAAWVIHEAATGQGDQIAAAADVDSSRATLAEIFDKLKSGQDQFSKPDENLDPLQKAAAFFSVAVYSRGFLFQKLASGKLGKMEATSVEVQPTFLTVIASQLAKNQTQGAVRKITGAYLYMTPVSEMDEKAAIISMFSEISRHPADQVSRIMHEAGGNCSFDVALRTHVLLKHNQN